MSKNYDRAENEIDSNGAVATVIVNITITTVIIILIIIIIHPLFNLS